MIASDRPGIGSGSFVLESGTLQLETGVELARSGDLSTYSFGQILARIGAPGFELEVLANSVVVTRADGVGDEGFQDLALGVKLPLLRGDGPVAASIQGLVSTPSGSDAFSADEWVPGVNALVDIGLGSRAVISVNAGYQAGPGAVDEATTLIVTPTLSFDGGFGVYGGWAGAFSASGDTHIAEAGATYLASPDVQLDVNGGYDVDRDDWFIGVGVAIRRTRR